MRLEAIGHNLGLALLYCLLGKLAILLALPPTYATPFFPSAGIALAALLVGGSPLSWGVALGAFSLALWTIHGPSASVSLIAASLIATGTVLQALFSIRLIKRWVKSPSVLVQAKDIGLLLLLGGPGSCWISVTISVIVLCFIGVLPWHNVIIQWWSWVVAVTLGIFIATPLTLIIIGQPRQSWQKLLLPVGIPMLLALLAMSVVYLQTVKWERHQQQLVFIEQTEKLSNQLRQDLSHYLDLIDSLGRLFVSSDKVTRTEFHAFTASALDRYPGIRSLSWMPHITDPQRLAYERAIWQEGFPQFEITEPNAQGQMVRRQTVGHYYPVTYIEPYPLNQSALGHDPGSEAKRYQAMEYSRKSRQAAVAIPVNLVQDRVPERSFLIYQAVFPNTVNDQNIEPVGYVGGAFHIRDIIEAALSGNQHSHTTIRLQDITETQAYILYDSSIGKDFLPLSHTIQLPFCGRHWQLEYFPDPSYLFQQSFSHAWTITAGGLFFISLLGAFLLSLAIQAMRAKEALVGRTQELQHTYDTLQTVEQQLRKLFEEREKMQLDLHDDLLQFLYTTRLNIERGKQLLSKDTDKATASLDGALVHLQNIMIKVRHYITRPSTPTLDFVGRFRSTLQSLLPIENENAPKLSIHIQNNITNGLSEVQATYLLRIAQEAVSNSLRHAQAELIKVLLTREKDSVRLYVRDDGRGFNYRERPNKLPDHQGLKNMTTRALLIGGKLQISSCPGKGTEISIALPVSVNTLPKQ